MSSLLYGLGVLLWLVGGGLFLGGTTSIHQALGGLLGVSGSVLFAAGAVVGAIQDAQVAIETRILVATKELKGDAQPPPAAHEETGA